MEIAITSDGVGTRRCTAMSSSTFILRPFDTAKASWDRLVAVARGAHLYHRAYWIDTLRWSYGFPMFVACLESGGDLLAGCVLARSPSPLSHRLIALPFSDRCEPLAVEDGAAHELMAALASNCSRSSCEVRGIEEPLPWHTNDCFINWQLDVSVSAGRLEQKLGANFRRNRVKAAKLGVKIESGRSLDHLQRFIALNTASRRRFGVPSQPARFFQNLWAASCDHDAPEIWLASHLGKDVAAVFLLHDGDTTYYKWSARSHSDTRGAGHLLVWRIIESLRGNCRTLDLGRTDARNDGLNRFKRELGATYSQLPYSFVPHAPTEISPEHVHGARRFVGTIWKHLPPAVCGLLSDRFYRYLA